MKVLLIDDDNNARKELETAFRGCNEISFAIDQAADIEDADNALKGTQFDVITIDLKFGREVTAGLQWMQKQMILASCPNAIKIIVTAYPRLDLCVKAMRLGAWDFIDKERNYGDKVVQCAVARLKEVEEARRVERFIFDKWLPEHEQALEEEHPGEFVAIDGKGSILAFGHSMIALGSNLPAEWLKSERKPFILQIARKEAK
jgi:DNA-binding NtrC family response regulator